MLHRLLMVVPLLILAGCIPDAILIKPVSSNEQLEERTVEGGNRDKIAIIEIEGLLANARSGGGLFGGASENPVGLLSQQLDAAAADKRVKAVVLRLNSPGGTVAGSESMYELVKDFRRRTGKPVIAFAQEVAASGAYYVACAANEIHAQPASVVGSIGVIFQTFEVSGTMAKLGVSATALTSGPNKDLASPFKPLEAEDKEVLQELVNEYYKQFTAVVHAARPDLTGERWDLATDGRVFSGTQAKAIGLIDGVGQLDEIISRARTLGSAPDAKVIMYRRTYGAAGSIYASAPPLPQGDDRTMKLELPAMTPMLPRGFYFLWQ